MSSQNKKVRETKTFPEQTVSNGWSYGNKGVSLNTTTMEVVMEEQGKKLNMFNIFCLGLGGAIGSGIFVLLGYGIAYTGRSIILVCVGGCLFMLLAYMYNIIMSAMFVFKGGDYSQKALLFNPMMTGFSAAMTLVNSMAMSSYALAVVSYIASIFPAVNPYSKAAAIIIMTLFFASSIRGSRFITLLENAMTIVLIAAIALFVIFGLPQVKPGYFMNNDGGFFKGGVPGFFSALAIMGWACQGTTMAPVSLVAVTEKPKKTIPIGILWVTIALAVVYGAMSIVAAGVLPYEKVAGSNLSATAKAIFPNSIYIVFVLGGGVCAIATSLLGGIAMLRYPLMKIAEDGWLPSVFKKQTKNGYPWVIQLAFYLLSVLPIILGFSLDSIVSLVMIPCMLMNVYLNIACITLPKRYPEQWKKSTIRMPIPVYNVVCVLSAGCAGIVAFNLFKDLKGKDMISSLIIIVICAGLSILRLKTGAVKKEDLKVNRETIITQAIADDAL
jgi:basic amino acid/polyamine antiporter, APA family